MTCRPRGELRLGFKITWHGNARWDILVLGSQTSVRRFEPCRGHSKHGQCRGSDVWYSKVTSLSNGSCAAKLVVAVDSDARFRVRRRTHVFNCGRLRSPRAVVPGRLVGVVFQLPLALLTPDDRPALDYLGRYFDPPLGTTGAYTGAAFDGWDSTGSRAEDAERFTADDLVAVTFLSVDVDARAAYAMLVARRDEFAELLQEVGPDRDLADETEPWADDSAEWRLHGELRRLKNVGPTTASKLFARKRPRLRPIYDSVIAEVTDGRQQLWEPLRQALRADDCALHKRLLALREKAGLPHHVSALRVFDVIAWMEGKQRGL